MAATLARPPLLRLCASLRAGHLAAFSARRCLSVTSFPAKTPLAALGAARLRPVLARRLATSPSAPSSTPSDAPSTPSVPPAAHEPAPAPATEEEEIYHGPLATTFRRLKILSLSSLTLTFALSPFFFLLETTSSIPVVGRLALAGIAMGTSGVSTALVAWCGRPYVTTLRVSRAPPHTAATQAAGSGTALELTTLTLALQPRVTAVYDAAFLVPTSRPFATWELAEAFRLPAAEVEGARREGLIPRDETIAETRTKDGELVGSWVVSWDGEGVGTCREIGQVARYFNVHQELLSKPIR